jgi:hypothetical protein
MERRLVEVGQEEERNQERERLEQELTIQRNNFQVCSIDIS